MQVGEAFVAIRPDTSDFKRELKSGVEREAAAAGKDAGKEFGQGFTRDAKGRIRDAKGKFVKGAGAGADKAGAEAGSRFSFGFRQRVGGIGGIGGAVSAPFKKAGPLVAAAVAAAVGGGITAGLGNAVSAAAQFDKTLRQFAAVADVPAAKLKEIRQLALDMGQATVFSAQEAAGAMFELAKGGLTAAEIQGGILKETLTLAAAGGIGLGDAATYMTNTLSLFKLKAGDAGDVAAALAGGAIASTASVESLGLALSQVGLGARTAGLDLNTTIGTLAAFDQQTLKGSDAGTSLKTFLTRIVPTTKTGAKAMKELGTSFVTAKGDILPITEIAQKLSEKMKGLSREARIKSFSRIFGEDASRAATALSELGGPALAQYIKATKDKGAAEKLAAVNTEGAAGAFEQFKGAIETAKIKIGSVLLPALANVARFIADKLIPTVAEFWQKHGPAIGEAFRKIGGFLKDTLGPALSGLVSAFKDNKAQIGEFLKGLGPVLVIVGVLAAAIVQQLVRSLTLAVTAFGAVVRAGQAIKTVLAPVFQFIARTFLTMVGTIIHGAATAFGFIPGLGPKLKKAAGEFDAFARGVIKAIDGITPSKTIHLAAVADLTYSQKLKQALLHPVTFAEGGQAIGPGTGTSDSILARVSNREFIEPVKSVDYYGAGLFEALRRRAIPRNALPGFAAGGQVGGGLGIQFRGNEGAFATAVARFVQGVDRLVASSARIAAQRNLAAAGIGGPGVRRALAFARSQVGKPYIWGATGPAGYDCSGFMSALTNAVMGRSPYRRLFATGSFPVSGWERGFVPGGFNIGSRRGNPGHMAGTLGGVNVESRGGAGVVVGAAARGARNGLFGGNIWHLAGRSGATPGAKELLPGFSVGTPYVTRTGGALVHRGERIFSAPDNAALVEAVGRSGSTYVLNLERTTMSPEQALAVWQSMEALYG